MSLAATAAISGVVGVFVVMIFLQIMVHFGTALANAVERRQLAAAAKAAEKKEREARRKKMLAKK